MATLRSPMRMVRTTCVLRVMVAVLERERNIKIENSGIYKLPDERTLVAEFHTTRNTIRAALDILRAEGLIDRIPGSGTVVLHGKYSHGLNRLLGLAETLQLPDATKVIYIERLRHLNGMPLWRGGDRWWGCQP